MVKKLALSGLASLLFITSSAQNVLANDNSNIKVVAENPITLVNLVSTSSNNTQKKYFVAVFSGHVSKGTKEYSNQGTLSYTGKREFEYNDELVKEFATLNKDGIEYTLYLATEDIVNELVRKELGIRPVAPKEELVQESKEQSQEEKKDDDICEKKEVASKKTEFKERRERHTKEKGNTTLANNIALEYFKKKLEIDKR